MTIKNSIIIFKCSIVFQAQGVTGKEDTASVKAVQKENTAQPSATNGGGANPAEAERLTKEVTQQVRDVAVDIKPLLIGWLEKPRELIGNAIMWSLMKDSPLQCICLQRESRNP